MAAYYITFGQSHLHYYNGAVLHKDVVALVGNVDTYEQAKKIADHYFGQKYSRILTEKEMSFEHYPSGIVLIN